MNVLNTTTPRAIFTTTTNSAHIFLPECESELLGKKKKKADSGSKVEKIQGDLGKCCCARESESTQR